MASAGAAIVVTNATVDPDDVECDITDTFTRTVSDGWGASESCIIWLDTPQSGELSDWSDVGPSGTFSVNGSRGYMAYRSDLDVSSDPVRIFRVDEGLPYPINVYFESQGLGPPGAYLDNYVNLQLYFGHYFHWDMNSWLVFSTQYSEGEHGFYYTSLNQGGYNWDYTDVNYRVVLEGDITAVWCWSIQIDAIGARAKKWEKGTTEPNWQISLTWDVVPPRTHFRNLVLETQGYNWPVGSVQPVQAIDNWDVGYCSGGGLHDTFTRTVSNGWGTSDSGVIWVDTPVGFGYSEADKAEVSGAFSVNGTQGRMDPEEAQGNGVPFPGENNAADCIMAAFGVVDVGNFEANVQIAFLDTTTQTDYAAEPQFYVSTMDGHYWHGVDLWLDWSGPEPGSGHGSYFGVFGGPDADAYIDLNNADFVYGEWWNLHWKITGGLTQASIWKDGTDEPAEWMVETGDANYVWPTDHGPLDTFYIFLPNVGQSVLYDNFDAGCGGAVVEGASSVFYAR